MTVSGKLKQVGAELKAHSPFTLFGALTGIAMMLLFRNVSHETSFRLFYIFHPAHVVLSAIVTASLFRLHEKTKGFLTILIVGYIGSVGVATLSDSILPYFGEDILGVVVPTEATAHSHPGDVAAEEAHNEKHWHIGFIEEWYCVLLTENEAASRFSYPDKHLGISGTHYDEHISTYECGSHIGLYYCSFYSCMAALLFQRHYIPDAVCQNRRRRMRPV
jgi:hypothetical protein